MSKSFQGNVVVEYLLPGTLVLTVCILGLQTFGLRLNTVFQGLKKDMSQSVHAAQQQEKVALAARQAALVAREGSLPFDAEPASKSIATIGANGITDLLASRLEQLIEQWKRAGKITEADANLLIQLANAGHQLADAQKLLEQAIAQKQTQVVYNGKTYQVDAFAEQFMYRSSTEKDVWSLNSSNAGDILKSFNVVYQQVAQSKIFQDPAMKQEVMNLSVQISAISESLGSSGSGLLDNSSLSTQLTSLYRDLTTLFQTSVAGAPIKAPKKSKDASELTHQDSGQICVIGLGKNKGTTCFTN